MRNEDAASILLMGGTGWELEESGNGHCLFNCAIEIARLRSFTPVDVRRACGAWMLRHPHVVLPGGITVEQMIRDEHGMTVAEYVARLLDPQAEAHDDDPSSGRRNYPQGTHLELPCLARSPPPLIPPPHPLSTPCRAPPAPPPRPLDG